MGYWCVCFIIYLYLRTENDLQLNFVFMDNDYIVSARKYRPASFDNVVGQSALTDTLKNSIRNGHLAHAYLFCGPRGVGKTTCARIFAKTINCMNPGADGEACGECESCRAFAEQRSLNIHELDAASNNGIEEMKSLIEQTHIPPQVGKYKVFIIDEVHMLSAAAFNAFLKTLEEPPHYVIFILATTEKHKLLPTILSRCQIYDFNRMGVNDIVNHLMGVAEKEGITAEPAALNVIAEKADGGMRDALSIFDQVAAFCNGNITYEQTIRNLNVLDCEYYFNLVDYFLGGDIPKVMTTFNDILNRGFEASHFVGGLNSHLRNLMMSRDAQTLPLIEASDAVRKKYSEQAQRCKPQFLYAAIRKCTDCDINYKMSQNRRLLVEITLIEIAQLAADDVPSSGRSPKSRILKPIFERLNVEKVAHDTKPAVKARVNDTDVAVRQVAAAKNDRPSDPSATILRPRMLGMSITEMQMAGMKGNGGDGGSGGDANGGKPMELGNAPIDQMALETAWREFAQILAKDDVAMAARMGALKPQRVDELAFEVVADNPIVMASIEKMLVQAIPFIRKKLDNGQLKIAARLRERKEAPVMLSRSQQFAKMQEINPAFRKLVKELNLELI